MPGSDDDDDHHAQDTDAPTTTTEKPHILPTPAGIEPPGSRRAPPAPRTRARADPRRGGRPASAAAREGDRSGAGRASRGDDDDDSGSESESDDGGHRFIPNSVGGRRAGPRQQRRVHRLQRHHAPAHGRVPYGTAAIYVAAAYFAVDRGLAGLLRVKWGGLLWGTGALATGTCCPTTA